MNRFMIVIGLWLMANFVLSPSIVMAEDTAEAVKASDYKPQVLREAAGPNRILMIDNFNYPNMLNLMAGETQGDEEEPGGLIPSYTPSGRLTMGRIGHSLKMDYDVSILMSIAYYWTRFGPQDQEPGSTIPLSLEGFNYLSFWIKTDQAHPRFAIEFHQDANADHLFTLGKDINTKIAVSSYILEIEEDISGITTEVIVAAEDRKYLLEPKIYVPAVEYDEEEGIEVGLSTGIKIGEVDITGEFFEEETLPESEIIEGVQPADEMFSLRETEPAADMPEEKEEVLPEDGMIEVMPSAEEVFPTGETELATIIVEPEPEEVADVEEEEDEQTADSRQQKEEEKEAGVQEEEEKDESLATSYEPQEKEPLEELEEKMPKVKMPEEIKWEEERAQEIKNQEEARALVEERRKHISPTKKFSRRSRKRVTFFQTEGPSDSPEKEVGRKVFARRTAESTVSPRPVEVKASSSLMSQPVVSTVMGSRGKKDQRFVEAPKHVRALRKEDIRWRKVVVPLERFRGVQDWSSVLEMVFVFANRLGSGMGIMYVDDIMFGSNYIYPTPREKLSTRVKSLLFAPLKSGVSAAAIRGVQMANRLEENRLFIKKADGELPDQDTSELLMEVKRNSREKLKRLFNLENSQDFTDNTKVPNFFLLDFEVEPLEPTLEVIWVEISNDNGKTWSIVAGLYDHQPDGEYVFPWRLPTTRPGQVLLFRLVASDVWGRAIALREPVKFEVGR
jgi:hypothetical protein